MSSPAEPAGDATPPATDPSSGAPLGQTRPAGEGVNDQEFAEEVAEQTSRDLRAEPVFEREAGGAATDTAIDEADADDLGR
jgi:hypothetical protein